MVGKGIFLITPPAAKETTLQEGEEEGTTTSAPTGDKGFMITAMRRMIMTRGIDGTSRAGICSKVCPEESCILSKKLR